jgi:hypothetical protein
MGSVRLIRRNESCGELAFQKSSTIQGWVKVQAFGTSAVGERADVAWSGLELLEVPFLREKRDLKLIERDVEAVADGFHVRLFAGPATEEGFLAGGGIGEGEYFVGFGWMEEAGSNLVCIGEVAEKFDVYPEVAPGGDSIKGELAGVGLIKCNSGDGRLAFGASGEGNLPGSSVQVRREQ